jgi:hypothetical protein
LIRYYGWYSNKKQGQRAKRQPSAPEGNVASPRAPSAREARKRWAALIKQVYETDPALKKQIPISQTLPQQLRPETGYTAALLGFGFAILLSVQRRNVAA